MVAIVSGNSLGLNLTSLGVLGDRGVFGNAAMGRNGDQIFVNVANGNLVLRNLDDRLAGVGGIFGSVRTYNSQGNFGHSDAWSLGAALKKVRLQGTINTASSIVYRQDEDGSEQTYRYDATRKLYVSFDGGGAMDTLAFESGTGQYVWTDGDTTTVERYEGSGAGRLLSSTDSSGNKQTFVYGSNGKIASVTDASGGVTYYDYVGANLTQIRTATTQNGTTTVQTLVRYSYDSLNRLSAVAVDLTPQDGSITDGKVFQTFYTYDGDSDRLATIAQTDGTQMAFGYELVNGQYRIKQVVDALGRTTRYGYEPASLQSYVIDANNQTTRFVYDANGNLVEVRQPEVAGVSATTKYAYDADGNVTRVENANGLTVTYSYDVRGNQTRVQDSAGNLITRSFDAQNRLLTETVYSVPAAGTQAASGAQTSRYVYDVTGNLRFEVSPEGRVAEYRYSSAGLRISSLTYAGNSYAVSGLSATAVPTLAQMTSWAAAANMAKVQRIDASYDYRGQLQQTIAYANVTSAGVGISDGKHAVTQYVYDQAGRLLSTVSPTNGTTSYTYDGLGRVISQQDAAGNVTLTQYDDAGKKVTVTQANGLRTLSVFDGAGQRISAQFLGTTGQNLGLTKYAYDAVGRLLMTTDPTGLRAISLYDAAGNKTADYNHLGQLTHYLYNAAGQLISTRRYSQIVSSSLMVDASSKPINPDVNAIIPATGTYVETRQFYDASGRIAMTVDAAGAVRQFYFDGAGRQTKEVRYANTVSLSNLPLTAGLSDVSVQASAQDATSYRYYTADGLLAGTVDAEGAAQEYIYDSAGRQVQKISYATRVTAAKLASATAFAGVRPASHERDASEFWLYNNQGRVAATISTGGYLTELIYDAGGNVTTQVKYATWVPNATATSTLEQLRPATTSYDQTTVSSYDSMDRLVSIRDYEGFETRYAYDNMGRRVSVTRAAATTSARSVLSRYDLLGRLVGELSGEGAAKITGNQTQAQVDAIWASYGIQYTYDLAGRRMSATDAAGARTLYYYDTAGKLTYTINALGYVEQRVYDNLGQLIEVAQVATPVSLSGLNGGVAGSAVRNLVAAARNASNDIRTLYTYTSDSRLKTERNSTLGVVEHSYDAFGNEVMRLTTLAGAIKRTDTFSYDKRNQLLVAVQDSTGIARTVTRSYDAFGREVQRVDPSGNVVVSDYDKQGRRWLLADDDGQVTTTYDAFDNVLERTDQMGRKTTYAYDPAAQSVTQTLGGISVVTKHNAFGETISIADGRGVVTSFTYNADGSLLSKKLGVVSETREYDAANRVIKFVDATGIATVYTYDELGRTLTEVLDPNGLNLAKEYRYDAFGRRYIEIDANGVQNVVEFDRSGRIVASVKDAAGQALRTSFTFDAAGRTLTSVAPNGMVTTYTYDALGQRITETRDSAGLKLITRYAYDAAGNVTARTDPSGAVTRFVLDRLGRVRFSINAIGHVQETRYNGDGQISAVLDYATAVPMTGWGLAVTAAQVVSALVRTTQDAADYRYYDASGRLSMQVTAQGQVTTFDYDNSSNLRDRRTYVNRLPAGQVGSAAMPPVPTALSTDQRWRSYTDSLGRLLYEVDGTGAVRSYLYDRVNRLLSTTLYAGRINPEVSLNATALKTAVDAIVDPSRDQVTTNTYDSAGRKIYSVDSLGGVTQYRYDAGGQLTEQIQYAQRLTDRSKPSLAVASAGDIRRTYSYDSAGRVVAQTDASGNLTRFVRNANGDVLLQIDATGAVTENRYNAIGQVVQQTQYLARISLAGLDTQVTETAVRALLVASTDDPTSYLYYGSNGRLAMTVNRLGVATSYTYDLSGNLTEKITYANLVPAASIGKATKPANPAIDLAHDQRERHVYDSFGRAIFDVDGTGAVVRLSYDSEGRVIERVAYAGRVASNIALSSAALEAALASIQNAQRDQRIISAYDGVGRLTHTLDGVGAVVQNVYDAAGNRTRQIRYATALTNSANPRAVTASAADRAEDWVYDGVGQIVASVGPLGAVTRRIFDANGNLVQEIRLATPLAANAARTAAQIQAVPSKPAEDRSITTIYDAANRPILVIDSSQAVTRNRYNAAGQLTESIQYFNRLTGTDSLTGLPASQLTEAALSSRLPAVQVQDRSTRYYYDAAGREVYRINALGFVTQTDYDAVGHKVGTRAYFNGVGTVALASTAAVTAKLTANTAKDRNETFVYDAGGRLLGMTDALNNSESYTYDGVGNRISFLNKSGKRWTYDFDAAGRLIKETAPAVAVTTTSMNAQGHVVAGTAAQVAIVTTNSYDGLGNLIARTEATGRPEARTTRYTFDAAGRQIQTLHAPVGVYDAAADNILTNGSSGNATRVEQQNVALAADVIYNVFGEAVVGRAVSGAVSYKVYSKVGALQYEVDAEGYVTRYDQDAFGNVVQQVRYAVKSALNTEAMKGLEATAVAAAIGAAGVDHSADRTITTRYDQVGNAIEITGSQIYAYDSANGMYFNGSQTTVKEYDAFRQVVAVRELVNQPSNIWASSTSYYDKLGNVTATVDPLGYVTTYSYDAHGNKLSSREYATATTQWDGQGFVLPATNAADRLVQYAYDQRGQLLSETRVSVEVSTAANGTVSRANVVTSFGYDALGNQTRKTNADGGITYSYYDVLGRVTAVAEQARAGVAARALTVYAYDAAGNQVTVRAYAGGATNVTETGYTATTSADDRLTLNRFDSQGRIVQTTDANGKTLNTSYNAGGQVAKQWRNVTANDGSVRTWFQAYEYDRLGQQLRVIDPASTAVLNSGIKATVASANRVDFLGNYVMTGTNSVRLNWSSLINASGGTVRVQINYRTVSTLKQQDASFEGGKYIGDKIYTGEDSRNVSRTLDVSAASAAAGVTLSWSENRQVVGGLSSLSSISVWQQDAAGNWIVKWTGTPNEATGSGVTDISQELAGVTDTAVVYNAFGEVVSKGINGGSQEYFQYDNAGNLIRTNANKGVDEVRQYNLQGKATQVVQTAGSFDLSALTTLQAVAASTAALRRTDTVYDLKGNTVEVRDPVRTVTEGGGRIAINVSNTEFISAAGVRMMQVSDENGGIKWVPAQKDESGNWLGQIVYTGQNYVAITWSDLERLGDGNTRVSYTYRDFQGGLRTRSYELTGYVGGTAVVDRWQDSNNPAGGVQSIVSWSVQKKDAAGVWRDAVAESATTGFGIRGKFVEATAPTDPAIKLRMLVKNASGTWATVSDAVFVNYGKAYRANAAALAALGSEYRVVAVALDGTTSDIGKGVLGASPTWIPVGSFAGTKDVRPGILRTYDRWGNVLSVSDPRMATWVTRYTYNANNQLTSESRPAETGASSGPVTKLFYDNMGRQVALVDAKGNVNGQSYDAAGNLVKETHADGGVYSYEYNQFGEKVRWVDALGNASGYSYDKLGRMVLSTHAEVFNRGIAADNASLYELGSSTITEQVTYDELGNKLTSANGAGEVSYFRYDLRGNVTGIRKPGQTAELRTAYDARGNKAFEADANNYAATWGYDYFGTLIWHTDIGGAQYSYNYDLARQLLLQTNTRGQSLSYTYDQVGRNTKIVDNTTETVSTYSYDHAGNKLTERVERNHVVYQNNMMAYDALGRLREVSDSFLRQSISYDLNGNRTNVKTTYVDNASRNRDYWYGYDAMNRQTTVEGINAALDIGTAQGHRLTYDLNGNRLSDTYWDKVIAANGSTAAGYTTEVYRYDATNRLTTVLRDNNIIDVRVYDHADRVVLSGVDGSKDAGFFDRSGLSRDQQRNRYDSAGRLINSRGLTTGAAGLGSAHNTSYRLDQAGNVLGYTLEVWYGSAYTNTYTYEHVRYEGYRETRLSGTSTKLSPGTTTYTYDANGYLTAVTDTQDSSRNQTLVNDASGRILQRVQNGVVTRSLMVNGEMLGTVGPGNGVDDFSPSYRPISGSNPQASPGSYITQAGDTLQRIAQQAYGDSRLWYLIAEANGLTSDRDLRVGGAVTIPNRVTGNHNDFKTFKPYDPGKLIGDTQPTMPVPTPKGGGGCGGFGQILTMVVAVVATIYTAGALSMGLSSALSAGFTSTMATGAGVMGGSLGLASVGYAAAAGAIGSVVSQGVGMAIGAQSKFSWQGVASSAIASGVTAGVGYSTAAKGALSSLMTESTVANAAIRGVISSTVTQGVSVAAGLQSKFNWAGVAAAGVGAAVGDFVGGKIPPSGNDVAQDFARRMATSFAAGAAGAVTTSVLGGGRVNTFQVAVDAFGNSLANTLAKQDSRQGFDPSATTAQLNDSSSLTNSSLYATSSLIIGGGALSGFEGLEGVPVQGGAGISGGVENAGSLDRGMNGIVSQPLYSAGGITPMTGSRLSPDSSGIGGPLRTGSAVQSPTGLPRMSYSDGTEALGQITQDGEPVYLMPSMPVEAIDPGEPVLALNPELVADTLSLVKRGLELKSTRLANLEQRIKDPGVGAWAETYYRTERFLINQVSNRVGDMIDTGRSVLQAGAFAADFIVNEKVRQQTYASFGGAFSGVGNALADPVATVNKLRNTVHQRIDESAMQFKSASTGDRIEGAATLLASMLSPKSIASFGQHTGVFAVKNSNFQTKQAGSGGRIIEFVDENRGDYDKMTKKQKIAFDFELGTTGAVSNLQTGRRSVPILRFDNPNPNGAPFVKWDGFESLLDPEVLFIDAKTRLMSFEKNNGLFVPPSVVQQLRNQSAAIKQNPGVRGVLEFPTVEARREAVNILNIFGIENLETRVRK